MALPDELREIKDSIIVGSHNDPDNPEFPPDNPCFPASKTRRIYVPGFSDVSIKDESTNPTGTHKDRMAWEIVVTYLRILESIDRGEKELPLPEMSIISTGNAALAIQTMLRKYGLPDLSVIVDTKTDQRVIGYLKGIGCDVFKYDLSSEGLDSGDILRIAGKVIGRDRDITSGRGFEAIGRFYDWFAYEVIGDSPDYVIMPYGTGDLFGNVLTINAQEVSTKQHDPRFSGNVKDLRKCNFIGAKTTDPESRAIHSYAARLPFEHINQHRIEQIILDSLCGEDTGVYEASDRYIDEALHIIDMYNDGKSEQFQTQTSPTGIFGLNWLLENKSQLPPDAKYIIVNTGCSPIDRILKA